MAVRLKSVVFWAVTPITVPLTIVFGIIEGIVYAAQWCLYEFEGWCFDLRKQGQVRLEGSGIWVNKEMSKW